MTTEIFSRKKNKAKLGGKTTFKLPSDTSVLAVIGNPINQGEDFRDDGYVYKKNKRLRKWFTHRQGWNHFWRPTLLQISRIEALYMKASARYNKKWEKIVDVWKKIFATKKRKDKHGRTAAIAHFQDEKGWGSFFIREDKEYGLCSSWDWLKEKPKRLINHELGNKLWKMQDQMNEQKIRYRLQDLLATAIQDKFYRDFGRHKDGESGKVFEININGRKYFYQWVARKGYQPIAWPGDNIQVLNWA